MSDVILKAGELRHRIQLQEITGYTAQASGEQDPVYTTIATLWAKISPVTGKELELSQIKSLGPTTTHHVMIRWFNVQIDPTTMRLAWTNHYGVTVYYSIDTVLDTDQRKTSIELYCTEYGR